MTNNLFAPISHSVCAHAYYLPQSVSGYRDSLLHKIPSFLKKKDKYVGKKQDHLPP